MDARNARRLVNELSAELDTWETTYASAIEKKDASLYRAFNEIRANVSRQFEYLTETRNEFPSAEHEKIDNVLERARHSLDMVDAFDDETALSADAISNFVQRLKNTNSAGTTNVAAVPSLSLSPRLTQSVDDAVETENTKKTADVSGLPPQNTRSAPTVTEPPPMHLQERSMFTQKNVPSTFTPMFSSPSLDAIQRDLAPGVPVVPHPPFLPSPSAAGLPHVSIPVDASQQPPYFPAAFSCPNRVATNPCDVIPQSSIASNVISQKFKELEAEGEREMAVAFDELCKGMRERFNERRKKLEAEMVNDGVDPSLSFPRTYSEAATLKPMNYAPLPPNSPAPSCTPSDYDTPAVSPRPAVAPAPSMLRPSYFHKSPAPAQPPYENSIGEQLLRITAENQGRELLIASRPPAEKRFSGDNKGVDFESHMNQFNLTTQREGVSDLLRFLELRHWFCGAALTVCSLYESEADPSVALAKAKSHLKREFGRQNVSAQKMLNDILAGKPVQPRNSQQLQEFVLSLEKTYRRAVDTGRESTFNSSDTINQLLRRRVEHLISRWSVECGKRLEKWDPDNDDDTSPEFTFLDFINFLKQQRRISSIRTSIAGEKKTEKSIRIAAAAAADPSDSESESEEMIAAMNPAPAPRPHASKKGPKGKAPATKNPRANNNNHAAVEGSKKPTAAPKLMPTNAGWSCLACDKTKFHLLEKCDVFLGKSDREKFAVVRQNGLCILCLDKNHLARDCPKVQMCDSCGGKHHTALHRDNWTPNSQ